MTTNSKSRARKQAAIALALQGVVARSGRWRREMLPLRQMSEAQMAETFTALLSEQGYRIINMQKSAAGPSCVEREPPSGGGVRASA